MENLRKEAAASYLGVSLSKFHNLFKEGQIPYYREPLNDKKIFFRKADLDKFLEEKKQGNVIEKEKAF